jgi:hypothetical protein
MQDSIAQRRLVDAAYQNQLAKRLRAIPEERALSKIRRLIGIEPKVGLKLANRVIYSTKFLEELLNEGLPVSNETTVRFWLESLGPRLGIDRTLAILGAQGDQKRQIASRSLYWLPLVFQHDPVAQAKIEQLRRTTTRIHESSNRCSFLESNRWGNAA